MLVPINLTGGSYQSRSVPLSAQVTRNFYPELQDDPFVKDRYVLQSWPGLVLFGSSSGVNRGMLEHKGVLYVVSGTNFYSVDSAGTHTAKGIVLGFLPVIMRGMDDTVIIATGEGEIYAYNGTTVTETTNANLETPDWLDFLNSRAIYGGDNGRFAVSAVGDSTDIDGLDYATAESNADDIVRGYVFEQKLFLFGEKTIEPWWNSDQGRPPYDRIEGGIITIGLAARMAVSSNDKAMYFLGDDRRVYVIRDLLPDPVSTIALSSAFEAYSVVSDAEMFCFTLEGQNFVHLTFPTEDKTWLYSESIGQWFELSRSGSTGRDLAKSHAFAYGKNLIADYRNSNIYYWDINTYTENGDAITRQRDSGILHGGLFGAPGREIELNRLELIVERGVGLVTGQGSDPVIMLQISYDGGKTFDTEQWATIGKSGHFLEKVEWHALGRFTEGVIRIKCSDPVRYSIHAANADIEIS